MNWYVVSKVENGKFLNSPLMSRKADALRLAKLHKAVVLAASKDTFKGGLSFGLDMPTFRAYARMVADFRVEVA